ncbi:excalibur calcium-binding domain-containing protein [Virgibacillus natechei]
MILSILGFFAIIASFVYLTYHFIKKVKNKERKLSKKLFYPLFVGGFIFMIVGVEVDDDSTLAQLSEEVEKNENLTNEMSELKDENESLKLEVEEIQSDKKQAEDELESSQNKLNSLTSNTAEHDEETQDLNDEIDSLVNEKEELTSKIEDLEEENSSLQTEVEDLQITAGSTNTAPTDDSTSSTTNNNSTYYENCTAARDAGAAPVYEGDPGYGTHLDRDRDGVGCE